MAKWIKRSAPPRPRQPWPLPLTRTIPKKHAKRIGVYAQQIGEVTWAWNRMQSFLAMIFATFVDQTDLKIGITTWNSLMSDDAQRKQLVAIARAKLPPHLKSNMAPNMAARIEWATKQADKLAGFRNDATHTPFMQKKIGVRWKSVPEPYVGQPHRVARLQLIGPARLFRLLRGDLVALGDYAAALFGEVRHPGSWTLPSRPRMRLLALWTHLTPILSSHPQQKAKSRRQPRSSRA
jgi:hypothetical protein